MALDDLLTPVKWLDEQVLRQYTKLSKAFEEFGETKYSAAGLCTGFGIFGGIVLAFHGGSEYFPIVGHSEAEAVGVGMPYLLLAIHDLWYSTRGMQGKNREIVSGAVARDFPSYCSQLLQRAVRLPLFVTGTTFFTWALVEKILGDHIPEAYYNLGEGLAFGGLASSMYIKDSNPKLLDKQPAWGTLYQWMREKAQSVKEKIKPPEPIPESVPVRAYFGESIL